MDEAAQRMVLAAAMPDGGKTGKPREVVEQAVRCVLDGGTYWRAAKDAGVTRRTVRAWVEEVKRRVCAAVRAEKRASEEAA